MRIQQVAFCSNIGYGYWALAIRASLETSVIMELGRLLSLGLLAVAVLRCGSANSDGTDNTSGGTGSTGGTVSTDPSDYSGKLFVNEVVPSNKTGATDEGGSFPDWLELYNSGTEDVSLAGFYISDDAALPTKATLDSALTVKAGGVLQLWADGDTTQSNLHLPYALSAAGEGLYLFDASQNLIDSVEWLNATADQSYSRFPDGGATFAWCATPTPNALNGSACTN